MAAAASSPCIARSHGNVVVLFVLHNREPVQPWPRSQSVTPGQSRQHIRAPRITEHSLPPRSAPLSTTVVTSSREAEPDALGRNLLPQTKQPPSNDDHCDLFAPTPARPSLLRKRRQPEKGRGRDCLLCSLEYLSLRKRKRERGFSLGDSYIIVHLEGPRCKSTIRCGLKLLPATEEGEFTSRETGSSQVREWENLVDCASDPWIGSRGEILSRISLGIFPQNNRNNRQTIVLWSSEISRETNSSSSLSKRMRARAILPVDVCVEDMITVSIIARFFCDRLKPARLCRLTLINVRLIRDYHFVITMIIYTYHLYLGIFTKKSAP